MPGRRTESIGTFSFILGASTLLRVGLILYSEWYDARSLVKYTDVDYRVFTDAAHFLMHPGMPGNATMNIARGRVGTWLGLGE
jgi:phosphatidylinositol glycan class M